MCIFDLMTLEGVVLQFGDTECLELSSSISVVKSNPLLFPLHKWYELLSNMYEYITILSNYQLILTIIRVTNQSVLQINRCSN